METVAEEDENQFGQLGKRTSTVTSLTSDDVVEIRSFSSIETKKKAGKQVFNLLSTPGKKESALVLDSQEKTATKVAKKT